MLSSFMGVREVMEAKGTGLLRPGLFCAVDVLRVIRGLKYMHELSNKRTDVHK